MIRRGYDTIYDACLRYKLVNYGGRRCTAPDKYHSERVVALVAYRVMQGARIEDAWREELDLAIDRDRCDAVKRNPR